MYVTHMMMRNSRNIHGVSINSRYSCVNQHSVIIKRNGGGAQHLPKYWASMAAIGDHFSPLSIATEMIPYKYLHWLPHNFCLVWSETHLSPLVIYLSWLLRNPCVLYLTSLITEPAATAIIQDMLSQVLSFRSSRWSNLSELYLAAVVIELGCWLIRSFWTRMSMQTHSNTRITMKRLLYEYRWSLKLM